MYASIKVNNAAAGSKLSNIYFIRLIGPSTRECYVLFTLIDKYTLRVIILYKQMP